MPFGPARPAELLRPVSGGFILLTLIAALVLDLLPLQGGWSFLLPDFVMLATLYWIIHHPMRINIGTAWFLGLIMDVADGSLLGQYALAYALTAFFALTLRRRVLMFPPSQQALHILPLLLLSQTIILLTRMSGGAAWTGVTYFLSSISGALLWLILPSIMQIPQRRRLKTDPQ